MKILVCGSMTFSPEMLKVGEELRELGHEVTLPDFTEEYARLGSRDEMEAMNPEILDRDLSKIE